MNKDEMISLIRSYGIEIGDRPKKNTIDKKCNIIITSINYLHSRKIPVTKKRVSVVYDVLSKHKKCSIVIYPIGTKNDERIVKRYNGKCRMIGIVNKNKKSWIVWE